MYKYVENFVKFVLSLFFCSLSMLQEKNIVASSNRSVPVNSVSLRDMNQSEGSVEKAFRETRNPSMWKANSNIRVEYVNCN